MPPIGISTIGCQSSLSRTKVLSSSEKDFSSYVADHACLHHFIDSQSPGQEGRTERAGGSLKEDLRKIVQECSLVTEDDSDIALAEAVSVRNTHPSRSGFSAQQRVFDSTLRILGTMLSDDPIDRHLVATDPSTEFLRSASIRDAGMKASGLGEPL